LQTCTYTKNGVNVHEVLLLTTDISLCRHKGRLKKGFDIKGE